MASPPLVVPHEDGRLTAVALGTDGHLYRTIEGPPSGWQAMWWVTGDGVFDLAPVGGVDAGSRAIMVVSRGFDGALQEVHQDPQAQYAWTAGSPIGPRLLGGSVAGEWQVTVFRHRLLDLATGATGASAEVIAAVKQDAATYLARCGAGSCSDLDYGQETDVWEHYRRLLVLAKAYRIAGGSDAATKAGIVAMLERGNQAMAAGTLTNWWQREIGVPEQLFPALLLLVGEDGLPWGTTIETISRFMRAMPYAPLANGSWLTKIHVLHAALLNSYPKMAAARDVMIETNIQIHQLDEPPADGAWADGSMIQHGVYLYNGSYGDNYLRDTALLAWLTRGTRLAMPDDKLAVVSDMIVHGSSWMVYRDDWDPGVVGRAIARRDEDRLALYNNAGNFLEALLYLRELDRPVVPPEVGALGKQMLSTWQHPLRIETAGLADRLLADSTVTAAYPSGARAFPHGDYFVFRRPGFFASVKGFSTRSRNTETLTYPSGLRENKRGARLSDGRFFLALGDSVRTVASLPAFDWGRLPGISVEAQSPAARITTDGSGTTNCVGTRTFVGGVDDGTRGVFAQDLDACNSSLLAHKSYFFMDGSTPDSGFIAFAGTVNSPTYLAETVVAQWPLSSATPAITIAGNSTTPDVGASVWNWSGNGGRAPAWAHADGVGYVFPAGGAASGFFMRGETQSGNWRDLSDVNPSATVTSPFLTLWFAHPASTASSSYAYVIVPGRTAAETQALAGAAEVVVNNQATQVVRSARGDVGYVFWVGGASAAGLQASVPCVVFRTDQREVSPGRFMLSIADPSQTGGVGTLRVAGATTLISASGGATVAFDQAGATVTFPRSHGARSEVVLE
jgi:hyaluronate lyase